MNTQLRKALLLSRYYANPTPDKPEHYDYYANKTGQLVASGDEKRGWQLLAGDEETQP